MWTPRFAFQTTFCRCRGKAKSYRSIAEETFSIECCLSGKRLTTITPFPYARRLSIATHRRVRIDPIAYYRFECVRVGAEDEESVLEIRTYVRPNIQKRETLLYRTSRIADVDMKPAFSISRGWAGFHRIVVRRMDKK